MLAVRETYIIDAKGKKKQVILNINDYLRMQDELEELDEIRAFDKAMANFNRENLIPFDQAIREINAQKNVL